MKRSDYFLRYARLAPIQIALIRSQEAYAVSKLPLKRPRLDVGASDGVFGEVLAEGRRNFFAAGVDIDDLALAFCRKKRAYTRVIKADARQLPFKNGTFASVISNQSLEHIPDVDKAIGEIARVLKRGGRFVFLVPTVYLDKFWLTSYLLGKSAHTWRNRIFRHHNLWPIGKWQNLLQKKGFKVISHQYVGARRLYFVSELFWPARLPFLLISRLLKREFLWPSQLRLLVARLVGKLLIINSIDDADNGPTMLIIAQKK